MRILAVALCAVMIGVSCAEQTKPVAAKAPFKVLYSNDSTNLESCVSPFNPASGTKFTPEMLFGSIDEAVNAGVDAYLYQPGFLYVPLWKSKVYPAKEHFEWFYKMFPRSPHTGFADYMMQGGDVVQLYLDYCKKKNVAAFISLRVNDYHGTESLDAPEGARLHPHTAMSVDQFRRGHPELRLGNWSGQKISSKNTFAVREMAVMDWAHPQVRERVLSLIAEVADYDIDGLELDFLRHFRLFNPNTTTSEERRQIVTEFIGNVRKLLDEKSKGKHRWLCLRVPAQREVQDAMGLDLSQLEKAGADMFNISANYYTVQDGMCLDENRAAAPNSAMYLEMTHVTMVGADPKRTTGDSNFYRRTTDEQFYTTAHLAYAHGFDGVSLFNFAYYREYGNKPERGPFSEPPFHVIPVIADKDAVAGKPQYYFLAPVWRSPYRNPVQMPKRISDGRTVVLNWNLAAPVKGFSSDGLFRIQTMDTIGDAEFEVRWNGELLRPSQSVAEPYKTPYPHLLGTPETLRGWIIPRALMKSGPNEISITQTKGEPNVINFADIAVY